MNREKRIPRANYIQSIERLGLTFHTLKGLPYWNEEAAYRLEEAEILELERATNELHQMCLDAVEHILVKDKFDLLEIPLAARPVILKAWDDDPPSLYGRFDFSYDGSAPPKLLEYNADTPTSLLESAVIQWHWLTEVEPDCDQFNSIWEGLIQKWRSLKNEGLFPSGLVHFACCDVIEDLMTTAVLMDTACESGLQVRLLEVKQIAWDHDRQCFLDNTFEQIETLFKLYPWEWMIADSFGAHALATYPQVQWIEPIWKMVLSNKGILPLLWELYPDHPNLLPAYFDSPGDMKDYARKPLLGREGANVTLFEGGVSSSTDGPYSDDRFICQALAPLPCFDGSHALVGSWVIDGEARGIGIRESDGPITEDTSRFVPHYFRQSRIQSVSP